MDIFDGDLVKHPELGSGVVVRSNGSPVIRVRFDDCAVSLEVLAADLEVIA